MNCPYCKKEMERTDREQPADEFPDRSPYDQQAENRTRRVQTRTAVLWRTHIQMYGFAETTGKSSLSTECSIGNNIRVTST